MASDEPQYHVGQVVDGRRWTGTAWEPAEPAPGAGGRPPGGSPTRPGLPWWKRWWVWAAAAGVVFLVGIAFVAGRGSAQNSAGGASPSPAASTSAGATSSPPSATATVQPTPTSANALDQARTQFSDTYGTYQQFSKSGTRNATITLPAEAKAGIVTMLHQGRGPFSVLVLDADNEPTVDSLAVETGPWQGTALYGANPPGDDAAKLKVTASGFWTILVQPVSEAPELTFPAAESGDGVFLYAGDAADWAITHRGSSNFVVATYQPDRTGDLLVNETGDYQDTVSAPSAPLVVSVEADGDWTIEGS